MVKGKGYVKYKIIIGNRRSGRNVKKSRKSCCLGRLRIV